MICRDYLIGNIPDNITTRRWYSYIVKNFQVMRSRSRYGSRVMSSAHADNPATPCVRIITAILEEIIERLIDAKALYNAPQNSDQ